ncbi:GTPase family protein [Nostoc sp. UIC 10890]
MTNLRENVDDFVQEIKSLNILVMGKTGVGKSTLINAIFGEETAKTGAGFPVTQYFEKYLIEEEGSIPIVLYDSAGCELGREGSFVDDTRKFLDGQLGKGAEEQIHVAWYLVSAPSARFEPFEAVIINKLYEQRIPVIIVLSQCDRAARKEIDGIIGAIDSLDFKKVYNITEISASPLEQLKIEPFGLNELVKRTTELLPKVLGDAFIARQVVDVKAKRFVAMGYVATSAIACFGTGFVPIPFTTPAAALTAQTVLWNQIAALYRFDKIKGMTSLWTQITTSKEALVTLTVTTIADFFVFDPISSSFAGVTAATFVVIVGFALTKTFEELAMKELDGVSIEEIENLLQAIFSKNFDKYKSIRIREKKDVDKLRDDFLNS